MIRYLYLLALLLALYTQAEVSPQFQRYAVADGLSHARVLSLAEGSDGFIWVGTEMGLNRFDGYRFDILRRQQAPGGLSNDRIMQVHVDRSGLLWLLTEDGLLSYSPQQRRITPRPPYGSGAQRIYGLRGDPRGGVWLVLQQSLVRLDGDGRQLQRIDLPIESLLRHVLEIDAAGTLWLAGPSGVWRIGDGNKPVKVLDAPRNQGQAADSVVTNTLMLDDRHRIWMGTLTGLFLADTRAATPRWQQLGKEPVYSLARTGKSIWAGTSGSGLWEINGDTLQLRRYLHDARDPLSIGSNYCFRLLVDRSGSLWIGHENEGLSRLDSQRNRFARHVLHDGQIALPEKLQIMSLHGGDSRHLWIASYNGGLGMLDLATGAYQAMPLRTASGDAVTTRMMGVTSDMQGRLWVASMAGVYRYDVHGRYFVPQPLSHSNLKSLETQTIVRDREGLLWAPSNLGLHRIDPVSGQSRLYINDPADPYSLPANLVSTFAQDRQGRRWVGTWGGGLSLLGSDGRFIRIGGPTAPAETRLISQRITNLYVDNHDRLWVSTDQGLDSLTADSQGNWQVRHYTDPQNPGEATNSLQEDSQGRLWFGTATGIAELTLATGQIRRHMVGEGLLPGGYDTASTATWRDPDGRLYFGANQGLTSFDPASLQADQRAPRTVITDFQVFNESVSNPALASRLQLQQTIEYASKLVLNWQDSVFSISFSGLHFTDPAHYRYAYKLDGFDRAWQTTGADKRFATYTHLDPGHYVFRVKAANQDGVWSNDETRLAITITPPFWATWWFRASIAVLMLLLGSLWYRARVRQLKHRNLLLERHVSERTAALNIALHEQEAILANALTGIAFLKDQQIIRCNTSFAQLLGYEADELIGRHARSLFVSDQDYLAMTAPDSDIPTRASEPFGDIAYVTRSGQRLWCVSHAKLVNPAAAGEGLVWVIQDVTKRREAEQALIEARDKAEVATRAKSDFLANMSHEIRTPMNAVIGLAHLALQTSLNDQQRDYLSKIHRAGQSLLAIINDILDFSKIEAGKLDMDIVTFRLEDVSNNLNTITGQKAADKRIAYRMDIAPDVPALLLGDQLRLTQVLINLVNNAIKFTPEGGQVELTIQAGVRQPDRIMLRFAVRDSGIGISTEQQRNLFQPFTQADGSTTRKFGGTGLGLSISRRLVELMGGEIGVDSQPGQGACFYFSLPFGLPVPDDARPPAWAAQSGAAGWQADRSYAGQRILLAEDNSINQQIAIELLDMMGIAVDVVENGQQAIEKALAAEPQTYAMILMDLEMPLMDGHSATLAIRQHERLAQVPIVALTAHAIAEIRERCLREGMQDYLTKPIEPAQLSAMLARWLKPSAGEAPLAAPAAAQTPTEAPASLPVLTGVDTEQGLRYLNGSHKLYLRLLQRFHSGYGDAPERLGDLLAEGDYEAAHRLVHTLKGLAANMGANQVVVAAASLEASLAGLLPQVPTQPPAELTTQLAELNALLQPLLAELAATITP